MSEKTFRSPLGDIAPALAGYTDEVLFGDVWKRPELSPRDADGHQHAGETG